MVFILAAALVIGILRFAWRKGVFTSDFKRITITSENAELMKVLLKIDEEPLTIYSGHKLVRESESKLLG